MFLQQWTRWNAAAPTSTPAALLTVRIHLCLLVVFTHSQTPFLLVHVSSELEELLDLINDETGACIVDREEALETVEEFFRAP